MSLDADLAASLTGSGRREARTPESGFARPAAPRTRPYRLTVDLPPAVHMQFSRWVIAAEEQLGRNVDKRQIILVLLHRLVTDGELSASVVANLH